MELSAEVVCCAVAEKEPFKDKQTGEMGKPWYQVCLQSDNGLDIYTSGMDFSDLVGKLCTAKFRMLKFEGKERIKLVSLTSKQKDIK